MSAGVRVAREGPRRDPLWAVLDGVMDPEVPVLSIVELGIVRDVLPGDDGVTVVVTPTYSGCPAMRVIEREITRALEEVGVSRVTIQTVHAPAWTTDWLSAGAREKLRAYGIAPPAHPHREDELIPLRRREPVTPCPRCGGSATEERSAFGSTACKAIWYCRDCRDPFEVFKAI